MSVNRAHDGRDLKVGDPVTLVHGGIANQATSGIRSRGYVSGFGRVNVQVHITESSDDCLVGQTVPVPGWHLDYGHVGFLRIGDELADKARQWRAAELERRKSEVADLLFALIDITVEREVITQEQGQQLWSLRELVPMHTGN